MKYRILGFLMITSIISMTGQAAPECNTTLTKDDRYDDLNKTLQCLNLKIQQLEQRITSQDSNIATPGSMNKAVNSPSPGSHVYSDDYLTVKLKSCSAKTKKIYCVLEYKNISDANIEVSIFSNTTYLVNDNGGRWDYQSNTAIANRGYVPTEIIRHTHLTSKFLFVAQDNMTGSTFNLFINHESPNGSFKIAFNDILLN